MECLRELLSVKAHWLNRFSFKIFLLYQNVFLHFAHLCLQGMYTWPFHNSILYRLTDIHGAGGRKNQIQTPTVVPSSRQRSLECPPTSKLTTLQHPRQNGSLTSETRGQNTGAFRQVRVQRQAWSSAFSVGGQVEQFSHNTETELTISSLITEIPTIWSKTSATKACTGVPSCKAKATHCTLPISLLIFLLSCNGVFHCTIRGQILSSQRTFYTLSHFNHPSWTQGVTSNQGTRLHPWATLSSSQDAAAGGVLQPQPLR